MRDMGLPTSGLLIGGRRGGRTVASTHQSRIGRRVAGSGVGQQTIGVERQRDCTGFGICSPHERAGEGNVGFRAGGGFGVGVDHDLLSARHYRFTLWSTQQRHRLSICRLAGLNFVPLLIGHLRSRCCTTCRQDDRSSDNNGKQANPHDDSPIGFRRPVLREIQFQIHPVAGLKLDDTRGERIGTSLFPEVAPLSGE